MTQAQLCEGQVMGLVSDAVRQIQETFGRGRSGGGGLNVNVFISSSMPGTCTRIIKCIITIHYPPLYMRSSHCCDACRSGWSSGSILSRSATTFF